MTATHTTDEEKTIYEEVTQGNPKHAEDALILLTARREEIPLVTNDRRLKNLCSKYHVGVMTTDQLLDRISAMTPLADS